MKSNVEKAAAVGGAALAVGAAVTGISIAGEQGVVGEVAKLASVASVLPGVEQVDLAQLMTSDDSVLANAVRTARDLSREGTLSLGFGN